MRLLLAGSLLISTAARAGMLAELLPVEKTDRTPGFIERTDMTPLAIAYEKPVNAAMARIAAWHF